MAVDRQRDVLIGMSQPFGYDRQGNPLSEQDRCMTVPEAVQTEANCRDADSRGARDAHCSQKDRVTRVLKIVLEGRRRPFYVAICEDTWDRPYRTCSKNPARGSGSTNPRN